MWASAWPVLLFVIVITPVADLCADAGLFDVAAAGLARLARGSVPLLYALTCLLAIVTTTVLSLDTTVVLLTPVAIRLARRLGQPPLPYAMACIWLANGTSMLLPVSNLTNLMAAQHLEMAGQRAATRQLPGGSAGFAALTWPAQLTLMVTLVALLWVIFGRELRGRFTATARVRVTDRPLLVICAVTAIAIGPALVLGVPAWQVALAALLVLQLAFWARGRVEAHPRTLLQRLPLVMAAAVLALFAGFTAALGLLPVAARARIGGWYASADQPAELLLLAGVGVLAANLINNLPAWLTMQHWLLGAGGAGGVLAPVQWVVTLIAVNAGPLITPWGSLANLLWWRRCRVEGVEVSVGSFAAKGLLAVSVSVTAAVLVTGWALG